MKTISLLLAIFLTVSSGDSRVLPEFSPSLLYQEESEPKARKAVQKHIFTVPYFGDYPACAEGYEEDGWGRCVKIIHINQDDYEKFILDKLNKQFEKEYESDYDEYSSEMSNEIPNDFRFQLETPQSQQPSGPVSPLIDFYKNGANINLSNNNNKDHSGYNPRTESIKEALLSVGSINYPPSRIVKENNEKISPFSTIMSSSSSSTRIESVTTTRRYEELSEVQQNVKDTLSESQTVKTFKETVTEKAPIEKTDFFKMALGFFQQLPIFNR